MRKLVEKLLLDAVDEAIAAGELPLEDVPEPGIERPRDRSHGDWASSVALRCAKQAHMKPAALAQIIATRIADDEAIDAVEVAGPGFINMRLSNTALHGVFREVREKKERYGSSHAGDGVKVDLEFISANPTGPMHLGHGRWAALGDVEDTSYTDETAVLDSTYTYTVRAFCTKDGKTVTSDYDRTGKRVVCVNYPILTSAEAAAGSITVEWNEMSGASEYYLYRKTMTSSWKRIAVVDGETLTYTDTSVTAGTVYIYTVRGKLGSKLSDYDRTGVMQMAWNKMDTVTYDSVNSSRPTYINGQMYLLTKDGHLVTDTTVTLLGSTWTVDSSGRIVGYVTDVMKTAASTLNSVGWDLQAAFNWVVKFTYYNRWMRPDSYFASSTATEIVHSTWYGEYGLAHQYGNCLVMNATLYQFEKVLGYECYFVEGYVLNSSGYQAPHGWTEVILSNASPVKRVFDANFTNETGLNGYNVYYGKSNTWRYVNYVRVA